jgi:hypothetical protein
MARRGQAELVTVYRNGDLMLVQIARDLLSGAGIEAFVFDAETSTMLAMLRDRSAVPARFVVYEDRA